MKERELIEQWLSWKKAHDGPGFSQKQLSADAGISQTYLSNIMTGMRNPGTKTVEKIAGALNLSMAEFYAGPPIGTAPSDVSSTGTGFDRSNSLSVYPRDDTAAVDAIQNEYEEAGLPDQEPVQPDSAESPPASESDYMGEPEKTGLALSDTTPDQLEKLFDSVGIPLAELFSMPTDIKLPKKPEQPPPPAEEVEPQKHDRIVEQEVNDQIPLLSRPPGGDFPRWLDSSSWETHVPRISRCSVEGNHVFAIRAPDDSMEPDLHQSDILIVNPDDKFIFIDGGIGIVVRNKRFYVRKIYIHKGDYLLIPSNSAYKMETAPIEEARIYKISLWVPAVQGKF